MAAVGVALSLMTKAQVEVGDISFTVSTETFEDGS